MSATGHYVLSFVTTSEIEISALTIARSRSARGELLRACANDTAADRVCFAEFVISDVLNTGGRWLNTVLLH